MKEITICITGGHASPALAVCEELKKTHPKWDIVWIGRKYALEGEHILSSEYTLVACVGIPFIHLTTGRLQRAFSVYTVLSLLTFPIGIIQSFRILLKIKPDMVVSFGGYISLPVAIAAYMLHIPVMIHEQTHSLGLANSVISHFAKKVCVTFPETLTYLPQGIGVVTGLPVRSEIFSLPKNPSFKIINAHLPILYITGGSTGAKSLNDKLYPIIPELIKRLVVIHQTGELSYDKASRVKKNLRSFSSRYYIAPNYPVNDVSWIYRHASVVLGRAGANTVFEVSAFGLPALFVPLPWSGKNEQAVNAGYYEKTGNAIIINQDVLTRASVLKAVDDLLLRKQKKSYAVPPQASDGATSIVREIDKLLTSV